MLAHLPEATDVFKWHVQECVLQILQRDCAQVQRLVEDAVRQLSAPATASSATPLDNCQLMEAMNDNHIAQLLLRPQTQGLAYTLGTHIPKLPCWPAGLCLA